MSSNKGILTLLVLLVLVGFAFGYVYSTQDTVQEEVSTEKKSQEQTLVTVMGEREAPSKTLLVSDKYVGDLKEGYNTVVIGDDGSIVDVREGVVLTGGAVISSENGEEVSVYRVNSSEKSVSRE